MLARDPDTAEAVITNYEIILSNPKAHEQPFSFLWLGVLISLIVWILWWADSKAVSRIAETVLACLAPLREHLRRLRSLALGREFPHKRKHATREIVRYLFTLNLNAAVSNPHEKCLRPNDVITVR